MARIMAVNLVQCLHKRTKKWCEKPWVKSQTNLFIHDSTYFLRIPMGLYEHIADLRNCFKLVWTRRHDSKYRIIEFPCLMCVARSENIPGPSQDCKDAKYLWKFLAASCFIDTKRLSSFCFSWQITNNSCVIIKAITSATGIWKTKFL